jgi:hypothetical protein
MIDIELKPGENKAVVTVDGKLFTEYRCARPTGKG